MAATNRWAQTLRQQLKLEHGNGWTVEEQSEKVKLVLRRPGARKQSVTLAIPWNRSAGTAAMKAVEQIRRRMEEQNLTLAEAHKLVAGAPTIQRIGQADQSGSGCWGDITNFPLAVLSFSLQKVCLQSAGPEVDKPQDPVVIEVSDVENAQRKRQSPKQGPWIIQPVDGSRTPCQPLLQ